MGWTKRQLVNSGWGDLGLSSYAFSLTPEMIQDGVNRLDSMMAVWNTQSGIRCGYNGASQQGLSKGGDDSGVPDHMNTLVSLGLAKVLGGTIGKSLPVDKLIEFNTLFTQAVGYYAGQNIPTMQLPRRLPVGAGNRGFGLGRVFFQPVDQLTANSDAFIDGNDGTPMTVDSSGDDGDAPG